MIVCQGAALVARPGSVEREPRLQDATVELDPKRVATGLMRVSAVRSPEGTSSALRHLAGIYLASPSHALAIASATLTQRASRDLIRAS